MKTANGGATVRINALAHAYPTGERVLAGVDLEVGQGEFVALVGPSGSGKTTLLRLVAGLLRPEQGTVRIDGRTSAEARAQMSFVFQEPALLPWRTVAANVGLGLELTRVPARQRAPLVAERLSLVGLTEAAGKYPHELSGGMRMRASLARALASAPRLLLMDEPFGALDEITRQRLGGELRRLWSEGGWTALFVTHSVAEAVFLAQRVVILGGQPARVCGEVAVPMDHPRDEGLRGDVVFSRCVREVSRRLESVGEAGR